MPKTITNTIVTSGVTLTSADNPLSITSTGTIQSPGAIGVYGNGGTSWTLDNAGLVQAEQFGVLFAGQATIRNTGSIVATAASGGYGVGIEGGGSVTNAAGAKIAGGGTGVFIFGGAGTVTNAGTIAGSTYAITFLGSYADRVILDPGAVLMGAVHGGTGTGATNTLELAAVTPAATGTLTGFSTQFTNFGTIDVDAGASWQFDAMNTVGATVTLMDAGTLANAGSIATTVTVASGAGPLTNTGTIDVAGTLVGVRLLAGGTVVNGNPMTTGALIEGYRGVDSAGAASVTNAGTIIGTTRAGIKVQGGLGTVTNTGLIESLGTASTGVALIGGGSADNRSGGSISGAVYGVYGFGSTTVVNAGTIAATGTIPTTGTISPIAGVGLLLGGAVTNSTGALITGATEGVLLDVAGTVTNQGRIVATSTVGFGAALFAGGAVTNSVGGSIEGGSGGVYMGGGAGTVTDAGTISGGTYAIEFIGTYADRVILDPGAVLVGSVVGATGTGATNTLELAPGTPAATGTLTGFSTQFSGFGTIAVDAGASWLFDAGNTIGAAVTLTDAGTLENAGSIATTVRVASGAGPLTNTGTIDVAGTLVGVTLLAGGTVTNGGTAATSALIEGFRGIASTGAVHVTNAGTISGTRGGVLAQGGINTVINSGTIAATGPYTGVDIGLGGVVVNKAGATISGSQAIVAGTVTNAGTLTGSVNGVQLLRGSLTNTGVITGTSNVAVLIGNPSVTETTAGTVTNSGTITGGYAGVYLLHGGPVTNLAGGTISSAGNAVIIDASGVLTNDGTIVSTNTNANAVTFGPDPNSTGPSATLMNNAGGIILGATGVVDGSGPLTVTNAGTIRATFTSTSADYGAVAADSGATITNSGLLAAPGIAVYLRGGASTVTNSGTITGGVDAIKFVGTYADRVILDPGAVLVGAVLGATGAGATNTLELAPGSGTPATTGTLTGFSTQFTNFGTIDVDAGASWRLAGMGETIAAAIDDEGRLTVGEAGTVTLAGSITGGGRLVQAGLGPLVLSSANSFSGGVTITQGTVDLTAAGAGGTGPIAFEAGLGDSTVLELATAAQPADNATFSDTLADFGDGDALDLDGLFYDAATTTASVAAGVLKVSDLLRTEYFTLSNPGATHYYAHDDGHGGTLVDDIACYARGTLILTASGEKPVEELAIGEELVTASGAVRPIKWLGRRAYSGRFAGGNRDILPICFKAGSLGAAVPRRDLWVSPKHAMYIDGVLIAAEHFVNGSSVVQASRVDEVEYHHVELDSHDVIIAEGALSETFVDDRSRGMFHNAHEYRALYPGEARAEAVYCAARVEDGFVLEGVRRRLAAMSRPPTAAPRCAPGPAGARLLNAPALDEPTSFRKASPLSSKR